VTAQAFRDFINRAGIAKELFEDTKTQFDLAKNSLERSQKTFELITDRLRKTQVKAPFDCTVLTRPVSVGQAVSGSGGFNSGTEVLTIANLKEMVINGHINQADITRLKPDQEVEVQVEAVPGLKVVGRIERIAPQATLKNNIKGYAVRVLLRDVDRRVRPGMTANVTIPVASKDNVLAVPLSAVFTERNPDSAQMERFVYVVKDGQHERRPVRIGVSDFFNAEVEDGLSAGDVVALEVPKEELARQSKAMAASRPGGTNTAPGTLRPAGGGKPAAAGLTNAPGGTRPAGSTTASVR
jgi:RND family efflux transporter MFP subunit